ncbi:hypothetical protein ACJA25_02630 [Mycoplasmopsis hyopharyngis]|uniref:hypothetical protein n=1 Tax=Mycoplasmopsis hyopharyngis TaxID=29558 RepID=UPI0038730B6E
MEKLLQRLEKNKKIYNTLLSQNSLLEGLINSDPKFKKHFEWYKKNIDSNFQFADKSNLIIDFDYSLENNFDNFEKIKMLNNWLYEIEQLSSENPNIIEDDNCAIKNFKTNDLDNLLCDYEHDGYNSPHYEGIETVNIDKTSEISISKFEF